MACANVEVAVVSWNFVVLCEVLHPLCGRSVSRAFSGTNKLSVCLFDMTHCSLN